MIPIKERIFLLLNEKNQIQKHFSSLINCREEQVLKLIADYNSFYNQQESIYTYNK